VSGALWTAGSIRPSSSYVRQEAGMMRRTNQINPPGPFQHVADVFAMTVD
jgi:hypothetical protein